MRILFLSSWFPYPPDNGSKIRVYHLLRALGRKHDVALLSFAFGTANPDNMGNLVHFCQHIQAVQRDPSARSQIASALRFFSPVPIAQLPIPEMTRAVRASLARDAVDTIIASTETMACYAFLGPDSSLKVLEEHNSMSRMMWDRHQAQRSPLQRLRCWVSWQKTRYYETRLFPRFDLCTMVSEQDRQACFTMLPGYRGRVEVIPNGVDCDHNRPGLAQPKPDTLIFNGALTYSANYDAMQHFLSQVYPLIRQQAPAVSLTITGSTKGVDLGGLRLDETVILSGYVDDIRPAVAGASVCIAPIRQGGGTRLKILEAMALGTPVVATSKGAEGLEAVDGEHLLLADEPEAFAAQVLRLFHDPGLRQRLATNARRLVEERYNWAEIGRRFVALVEEVAREKRHR